MPPWPICDPAVMKRMKGQAQAADPIPQPNARGKAPPPPPSSETSPDGRPTLRLASRRSGPGLVGLGRLTASN